MCSLQQAPEESEWKTAGKSKATTTARQGRNKENGGNGKGIKLSTCFAGLGTTDDSARDRQLPDHDNHDNKRDKTRSTSLLKSSFFCQEQERQQRQRWRKRTSSKKETNRLGILQTVEPEGLCVMQEGEWECIELAVDSGATETVISEHIVSSVDI